MVKMAGVVTISGSAIVILVVPLSATVEKVTPELLCVMVNTGEL